jgi:hypothetical protein
LMPGKVSPEGWRSTPSLAYSQIPRRNNPAYACPGSPQEKLIEYM